MVGLEDELAQDDFLYRFRQQPGPLGDAEGAFLLCGFTMALALHQQRREVEATRWFERNRAACGPPGLYSEEYDIGQRRLRGNLPQAFVHALMFESSTRLAHPWQDPTAMPSHHPVSRAPDAPTSGGPRHDRPTLWCAVRDQRREAAGHDRGGGRRGPRLHRG